MFSKTMILFFCVALYFSKCQGARPNQNQLEAITRIVNAHGEPDGLSYDGLLEVVSQVKTETDANENYFNRDAVEARFENTYFTKEEVVFYTRMILGDNESAGYVRALYDANPYGNEVKFLQLGLLVQSAAQNRHRDVSPNTIDILKAELTHVCFLDKRLYDSPD
ncbi:uncharacterized protein LOC126845607 isoform X2 [Adelges cooleyi]|uniref:uncharacterized protein LOC126845607 isoform X2 n=1 Tax=Adelges cooleyi TaxID=133065 RepID=UPI002180072E|nr:uncharacterized protein LOC126845607 isoform X2 [Adelges cooleyi]